MSIMVFKRVKQWLGIEGVKMEIILPEEVHKNDGEIRGEIQFSTMNTQRITQTKIQLIEKFSRGRKKKKRIDEYLLGEIELDDGFMVYPDETKSIEFVLPFTLLKSNMDNRQDKGGLGAPVASFLKWTRNVKSEYRIEAESTVQGTALSPFDRKIITFS